MSHSLPPPVPGCPRAHRARMMGDGLHADGYGLSAMLYLDESYGVVGFAPGDLVAPGSWIFDECM